MAWLRCGSPWRAGAHNPRASAPHPLPRRRLTNLRALGWCFARVGAHRKGKKKTPREAKLYLEPQVRPTVPPAAPRLVMSP